MRAKPLTGPFPFCTPIPNETIWMALDAEIQHGDTAVSKATCDMVSSDVKINLRDMGYFLKSTCEDILRALWDMGALVKGTMPFCKFDMRHRTPIKSPI